MRAFRLSLKILIKPCQPNSSCWDFSFASISVIIWIRYGNVLIDRIVFEHSTFTGKILSTFSMNVSVIIVRLTIVLNNFFPHCPFSCPNFSSTLFYHEFSKKAKSIGTKIKMLSYQILKILLKQFFDTSLHEKGVPNYETLTLKPTAAYYWILIEESMSFKYFIMKY